MSSTTKKMRVSPEIQRADYFKAMYEVALRRGMKHTEARRFAQRQVDEQGRLKLEADQEKARLKAERAKLRRQNKSKELAAP